MSADFYKQIYENLDLKETDELLEIWKTNDRAEWSGEAFQAIKAILEKRAAQIPEQGEPVYEHNQEIVEINEADFSKEELKIIDDENQPDFYDPFEVLKFAKWTNLASKTIIAFYVVYNLMVFSTYQRIVQPYFVGFPQETASIYIFVLAAVLLILNTALSVAIAYFSLIALSHILRILMEMEFNSRKAK